MTENVVFAHMRKAVRTAQYPEFRRNLPSKSARFLPRSAANLAVVESRQHVVNYGVQDHLGTINFHFSTGNATIFPISTNFLFPTNPTHNIVHPPGL
jgi:hypothetical protein